MYDGIEVDMLSLGDADCILVSFWGGFSVHRVLIDGGNKGDAATVREFLDGLQISTVDDVLATHLHDDHSGGLIELLDDDSLTFGKLWCHVPQWHVPDGNMGKVEDALRKAGSSIEAESIRKALQTVRSLYAISKRRGIAHEEPFANKVVGKLTVCSPTERFYDDLVIEMTDVENIMAEDVARERYEARTALEEKVAKVLTGDESASSSLLTDPHTSPENESSVVTGAVQGGNVLLFTSDAGTCALTNVVRDYQVAGLHWMQIPHHGSRRNLTDTLIRTFAPKIAYVSAIGNVKHPRRAVVNAFKSQGTQVFSTHYPNSEHLRYHVGSVPERFGYGPATPLWDAEVMAKVG